MAPNSYAVQGRVYALDLPQTLVERHTLPGFAHKRKEDWLLVVCLRDVTDAPECRFEKGDWVELTLSYTDESEATERGVVQ